MSKIFDALKRTADANHHLMAILDTSDQPAPAGGPDAGIPPGPPPSSTGHPASAKAATATEPPRYRVEHLRLSAGTPVIPFDGTDSRASEQYRLIRTRVVHDPRKPRMLLISSASPRDGKTITSVNLAAALALKSDSRILLIDGDLRRPAIAAMLGISAEPGLGSVLRGECTIEEAIIHVAEVPGLYVLPAGHVSANPTELLDSARWAHLCASIRTLFHHTVIDSPPVNSVADYELLEKVVDGVIVVVRPDHTNRALAYKVLEGIPRDKQFGLVVNCATEWFLFKPASPFYYYGDYR